MLASNARSLSFLRWLVVGFGFLALALAFSARATIGLVMPVWADELGWSRSFVSGAAAAALLVMAAVAPFAGRFIDRQGARTTLALGLVLVGLGCTAVSATSDAIVFLISYSGLSVLRNEPRQAAV